MSCWRCGSAPARAGDGRSAVCRRVVDRVLGGRAMPPTVIRALGPAERGVLAAVLAPSGSLDAAVDLGATAGAQPGRRRDRHPDRRRRRVGRVRLTPAAPRAGSGMGAARPSGGHARGGCGSRRTWRSRAPAFCTESWRRWSRAMRSCSTASGQMPLLRRVVAREATGRRLRRGACGERGRRAHNRRRIFGRTGRGDEDGSC